jgi:hypothetical protein
VTAPFRPYTERHGPDDAAVARYMRVVREIPRLESAIDHYFEVEAEIIADLKRRNDADAARARAAGDRIDRFLEHARSQMGGE